MIIYGYKYNAKYIGGPADGLLSPVISVTTKEAPLVSCVEISNLIELTSPLGEYFVEKLPHNKIKIAVYLLDEQTNQKNAVKYYFIESMRYSEYLEKYGEMNA